MDYDRAIREAQEKLAAILAKQQAAEKNDVKDPIKDIVEEKPNVVKDPNEDRTEEKLLRGSRCQRGTGPKESFQIEKGWPMVKARIATIPRRSGGTWRAPGHTMKRSRKLPISFIAVGSVFLRRKTVLRPRPKRGCSSW